MAVLSYSIRWQTGWGGRKVAEVAELLKPGTTICLRNGACRFDGRLVLPRGLSGFSCTDNLRNGQGDEKRASLSASGNETKRLLQKMYTAEEERAWKDHMNNKVKADGDLPNDNCSKFAVENRRVVLVDSLHRVLDTANRHHHYNAPRKMTMKMHSSEVKNIWKAVATDSSSGKHDSLLARQQLEHERAERERHLMRRDSLDCMVVPGTVYHAESAHDSRDGDRFQGSLEPIVIPRMAVADEFVGWKDSDQNTEQTVWNGSRVKGKILECRTNVDIFMVNLDIDKKKALPNEVNIIASVAPGLDRSKSRRLEFKPIRPQIGGKKKMNRRAQAQDMLKSRRKAYVDLCNVRDVVADSLSKVAAPQMHEKYSPISGDSSCLGEGRQGVVNSIEEIATGRKLAVKTCDKFRKFWNKEDVGSVKHEVAVLQKLPRHPNLIEFVDSFESPVNIHILTEQCFGGDLFTYLSARNFEPISEQDSRKVLRQVFAVIAHCHSHGIVHLDVKLENLMRRSNTQDIDGGGIVLLDFGHSRKLPEKDSNGLLWGSKTQHKRPVGSPSYAAPEVVLECRFDERSDVWSVGVVTFVLLQGYLPFPHLQSKQWRHFTLSDYADPCNWPFRYREDWEKLSAEAQNFCQKLLTVDVSHRYTVQQALDHPWMKDSSLVDHDTAISPEQPDAPSGLFGFSAW